VEIFICSAAGMSIAATRRRPVLPGPWAVGFKRDSTEKAIPFACISLRWGFARLVFFFFLLVFIFSLRWWLTFGLFPLRGHEAENGVI